MQEHYQGKKYEIIIVGAGILGTFHAYHALQLGMKVLLLEKNRRPRGASTQNFGQVVPSGMNFKWQRLGRESLRIYREIQQQADISVCENGSVYFASNEEEVALLEELFQINQANDYPSRLLTKSECLERFPGLKSKYCQAGLYFPQEVSLNPRVAVHRIIQFLQEQHALDYLPDTLVVGMDTNDQGCQLVDSAGNTYFGEQVMVCNGSEFKSLFPDLFCKSDLEVVKLQMLQTAPQPTQRIPGNILTGLTIRRYESFRECPSYQTIKSKEDPRSFAKEYGIHILFKQAEDGSVIIGDSHEYADVSNQDDLSSDLDNNINRYLMDAAMKIFDFQTWKIAKAWYGMYSQCKTSDIFRHTLDGKIHIVTGIGGKGMTASPAFAKENLYSILKREEKIRNYG